ncbi:DUF4142 domain-containing protein [Streptomyces sp. NRRL S-87]|uniref:DUF4142 domain-containing protein n=1 Tax=Streptomyces sp. NRRL S-87 TaxID=1463920 RepID=UPI00099D51D8|nr:DUF4142 domain-containing protein [Streptomyces sp. NRRL S-87]
MLPLRLRSLPDATRHTLAGGLVIGALALTLLALLVPVDSFGARPTAASASAASGDDGLGTLSTPYGPLTAQDRDFVRKVRLAGLWEGPAGRQAQQRGRRASIRTAGDHLVMGHSDLDRRDIEVGQALGLDLPTQPTEQQQGWLSELDQLQGDAYERRFVQLVRAAHGKVFALVALVRANTRNSMVRALATTANATVLDHMTVLEDTGLVDFEALVDPSPAPGAPASSATIPTAPLTK